MEKKSIEKCLKKDAATSSEAGETEKEKKEKTSSKPVIPDVLVRNIKEVCTLAQCLPFSKLHLVCSC